jgi:hypothetical protein
MPPSKRKNDTAPPPTINHSERAHAPFSPSATDRWMNCPASVNAAAPAPDSPPNKYTIAGTLCHEQAEKHLRDGTDPAQDDRILLDSFKNAAGHEERVQLTP